MTALALTLARWAGDTRVLIDLDRHGREPILPEVDLTRTLGWFTSVSPHVLRVDPKASLVANLKAIKEQLREAPHRGLHYGLLRYLDPSNEIAPKLRKLPQAQILFNYMGQLDPSFGGGKLFSLVDGEVFGGRDPNWQRPYEIAVNADVLGHGLRITWDYSSARYHRSTIETLAQRCAETLQTLVANCLLADTGGYTPSDFPLAGLGQKQCDQLFGEVRGIEDVYPLTPLQQGILFHALYAPGSGTYVEQLSCTLEGPLDVVAFAAAWQQVVGSHPILRSSFLWEGLDSPLQVVHANVVLPIEEQDWRGLAPSQQTRRWAAYLEADRQSGFDFSHPPLMRLALMRCGEARWFFLWSHHHVLLDGWSGPLVLQDAFAVYKALGHGNVPRLTARRPFRDYLEWLAGRSKETAETYWRRTLAGFHACTPLPFQLRPESGSLCANGPFAESRFALSVEKTRALEEFARREKVTLNTLVQGAWAILLGRCSGERDVLFGVTVSGRPAELAGAEAMVGLFINTLPLRVDLPPEARVADWLRWLLQENMELREHEHASLVDVQSWSELPRGKALFECLLAFENYPVDEALRAQQGSISAQDVRFIEQTHYSLTIVAFPGPQLVFNVNYDCRRFDEETIARMAKHFSSLLARIISFPDVRLGELSLLGSEEWHRQVVEWNGRADYGAGSCIHDLFEEQARRTPEAIALVFGDERLSYRELDARANQLAHHLRSLGAGPERVIGICAERSLEMVVGILAILKSGGAYLPLDPASPAERLAFMLEDAGAALVLTQENLLGSLPQLASAICLDRDRALWASAPKAGLEPLGGPGNLAYIIYTSGSTGRPKGVAIIHRNTVAMLHWAALTFTTESIAGVLAATSLNFDLSVFELFAPLCAGGKVILINAILELPRQGLGEEVTLINTVPSVMAELLRHEGLPPSIRTVNLAGEPLPQSLAQALNRCRGLETVFNLYGPSECTTYSSFALVHRHDPRTPPIGRPISNTQIYIVDERMRPAPVGVAGELCIGGAGVSRGYLGRPGLTAERFVPNPFVSEDGGGERLYRTGDLACYRADGTIEFLGRIDHQVKIRGFRIELGEIEARLMEHPQVQAAAAAVVGENKQLIAYFVPDPCVQPRPEELSLWLSERLPLYMVPTDFVQLASLPLTANGKLDRKRLSAPDATNNRLPFTGPRNAAEEILVGIWEEVLGQTPISINANFFELGGHSLLATQVVSRIRKAFQVDLSVRALFEAQTPEALAQRVRACEIGGQAQQPPRDLNLSVRTRSIPIPLSFAQQRLWFLDRLEPESPLYNMPLGLRLAGRLDVLALKNALNDVIRRHEVLRTCFPLVDGHPVQSIAQTLTINLPVIRLIDMAAQDQPAELRRLASVEAGKPFDLGAGPLIRGCIFQTRRPDEGGRGEHVLLLTLHHSIADGWSRGILVRELAERYENFASSQGRFLNDLTIQYADYTLWQREYLAGEELNRQLTYWRYRLSDVPELLQLPADQPRPKAQSYGGDSFSVRIPQAVTEKLRALARRNGATLFMVLLAAFKLLLSRYSGQKDICVGTPVANRPLVEFEALIGCFVNTLVLRTNLAGNPRFTELLARVRTATLEAQEHQDLPFERLVTELGLERDIGRNPLFQVSFSLDNTPQPRFELKELSIEAFEIETATAMFDLAVDVTDTGDGLLAVFEFSTDLFSRRTSEKLAAHYLALLDSAVIYPDARISELVMLTEPERRFLISAGDGPVESGRQAPNVDSPVSVVTLIEESVTRFAEQTALLEGDTRLTYREINIRANRLAHRLIQLGVRPEAAVGIYAERSAGLVIAIIAVLKAGGAYVPLDPHYPSQRLRAMVEDSAPAIVLAQAGFPDELAAGLTVLNLNDDDCLAYPETNPAIPIDGNNLAYILFTSGSTGRPKGVAVPHRALANRVLWGISEFNISPNDVTLQLTSPSFDVSAWEICGSLSAGACLVIAGPTAADPAHVIELVQLHCITVIEVVPSLLLALMRTAGWSKCPTLRLVCCGGEAMSDALRAEFVTSLPGCRLLNMYGPTETTIDASYFACDVLESSHTSTGTFVPLGKPIRGARLYVLDRHLNLVPTGVIGELFIGGAGLARGYYHQPGLTAEHFIPDPFGDEGGRLYRTGDLARWRDDGVLKFCGRTDHQVKLRGLRIELEEIEACLEQYSGVTAAAVAVQRDCKGMSRLAAYVETKDATVTPALLRSYARTVLPAFMVPSLWSLMAELPRDENGKLRRSSLPPVAGATDRGGSAGKVDDDPLLTETEETLARIWADVLGLSSVGRHDGFFDLGGHSLLAVQLTQKMREALQADIPLVALFQFPTIAALAEWLQSQHNVVLSPLVKVHEGARERSPLYLLHTGVGHIRGYQPLIAALDPAYPIYGIQMRAAGNATVEAHDYEAVISDYIEVIRPHHPGSSYRLLGWSHGGLIAIGMAARLSELGADVSFVGLIDTDLPRELNMADWKGRLVEFLKDPEDQARLAALLDHERTELEQFLSDVAPAERPAAAALWGREKGLWFNHVSLEALRLETSLWRHVAAIEDTFKPPRFTGDLHVWWAKASLMKGEVPAVDWAKISGAKTHQMIIDADHHSIIASPDLHASIRQVFQGLDP